MRWCAGQARGWKRCTPKPAAIACWAAMAGLEEMGGQARWRCCTNAQGGRVSAARCDADKEVDA